MEQQRELDFGDEVHRIIRETELGQWLDACDRGDSSMWVLAKNIEHELLTDPEFNELPASEFYALVIDRTKQAAKKSSGQDEVQIKASHSWEANMLALAVENHSEFYSEAAKASELELERLEALVKQIEEGNLVIS